ncbi:hypothetical protein [Streptomyces xanthochromogenes]
MSAAPAPSVRQLYAVVDRLHPPGPAGEKASPRRRQLRMVAGMWERAIGRDGIPARASRSVGQLFTRPALRAFWGLAVSGQLRAREDQVGLALPLASQRIVRDCLAILAEEVVPDTAVWLPVVPQQAPKATVGKRPLDALYRGLVDMAAAGPLERAGTGLSFEDRARLLAMVSVMLDAAPRAGEMELQTLAELAPGETHVGVRRRQQRAPRSRVMDIAELAEVHPASVHAILSGDLGQRSEATRQRVLAAVRELEPLPEVEWYELREGSRVAVRQWLRVRKNLVAGLEGAKDALWVALVATKAGPPGLPLRAEGIRLAYVRGITALNMVMAGQYGWEPMPTKLEQLRRSVAAVPVAAPAG